jgi:hypothetical protein
MRTEDVKARRDYWTMCGTEGWPGWCAERVHVTGHADVNGARWHRVREGKDRVSKILMHASRFEREAR